MSASEKRTTAAGRRWLRSYLNGCAFKIFDAPLPEHLAGLPFASVCEWMYRTGRCVLIGKPCFTHVHYVAANFT